ncbi:type I DNA topoisomerase [Halovulum sp. GXIMD14794]
MAVVVVESPAKAKTINAYLGKDYTVLASYGHVRDLPPKDGSVDTEHDFEMLWEVDPKSQKHVRAIADALKDDDRLILATDPDREGEAISWHLLEALTKRRAVKKSTEVERVVFNAITKNAVTQAMQNPRQIDMELVEAYLARRALDYLVGFNLSPVLWRKLPGAKSAGRVQSVALRLIVEREMEIEAFNPREYWSVRAMLESPRGQAYEARLTTLGGKKLDRYDLENAESAELAVAAVASRSLKVASVEAKPQSRNPSAPFMTSTLQQEASRKFGMGARATMSAAQRLYEAGHITYMRTDGIDMAPEAVMSARDAIKARYGEEYLPNSPRMYKNKAKNAQEAHECIRPTDMSKSPDRLNVEPEQRKLYDLIWKRTIASQMAAARLERTTVDVASDDGQVVLRATGQVVMFDGFLKVYEEGRDDVEDDDDKRLPQIHEGEAATLSSAALRADFDKVADGKGASGDKIVRHDAALLGGDGAILGQQHFTQPPPRYTEATLVKRMEELGIGRPSTYASIVSVIQERDYVRKEKNRLIPEDKGRLVTAFLENYFRKYVGYDFTAQLEEDLDRITNGEIDWHKVLRGFWQDFSAAIEETKELRITDVLEKINEVLAPHIFPPEADGSDPRICKNCGNGRLSLKTARSGGAFIGCSNYPECRYTRPLSGEVEGGDLAGPDGKLLGHDEAGEPVTLRTGRFGPYVQLGELTEDNPKPKRASIPKGADLSAVDLERALQLLSLPRRVGDHPDGGVVEAAIGRFGPYVVHEKPPAEGEKKPTKIYANIKDPEEVYTIGMNRAMELIAQKAASRGGRAAAKPLKELGEHPDGGPVNVMDGRYGPYVKWEKVNATIPKGTEPQDVTMEMAVELIAAKKPAKKKAAAKKTTAKKTTAKKPAAKKTATKKTAAKPAD